MASRSDSDLLDWAAQADRVIISHDVNTLPGFAWQRVSQGNPMVGLVIVPVSAPLGQCIDDLLLIDAVCDPEELRNQVWYCHYAELQGAQHPSTIAFTAYRILPSAYCFLSLATFPSITTPTQWLVYSNGSPS